MERPILESAAFAQLLVPQVQAMVESGSLPAGRWTIDGPHLPPTHVQGVATVFTAQVGESEVVLRRCDIIPGRNNPDWLYSFAVSRNDVVVARVVSDQAEGSVGRLVESVTAICRPALLRERAGVLTDFSL